MHTTIGNSEKMLTTVGNYMVAFPSAPKLAISTNMMEMFSASSIWGYNMRVTNVGSSSFTVEATVHASTNIAGLGLQYVAIDSALNHVSALYNQDFKVLNGGTSN